MLERIILRNVGPAPEMQVDFAPRMNLLTGDNGVGKSFLLDVAWWVLTRRWPQEVNPRMTSGLPARPRDRKKRAEIEFRARGKTKTVQYKARYLPAEDTWKGEQGRPWMPGLVLYAQVDGSFSVWDPARNDWKQKETGLPERCPAYVFTEAEVWDGLWDEVHERPVPICNGLLRDWSSWLKARDNHAKAMKQALKVLSPGGAPDQAIKPGRLVRLSIDDAREIPSIDTRYAGRVPILHASSGIRRAAALAYMLIWAWSEHRLAAELRGENQTQRVVILLDEVESHLHPRWQRSILKALREVVQVLLGDAKLQLIVSTHSPLVLASAEPWFDPQDDAWLDLDLEVDPPRVSLRRRSYTPRGTAGAWLTSEAFDLATDRGSVEAEQAILRARKLVRQTEPSLEAVMEAHAQLRAALPDIDPFWVRWNAFVESRGGEP